MLVSDLQSETMAVMQYGSHTCEKGHANYKLLETFDILSVDELQRIVSD